MAGLDSTQPQDVGQSADHGTAASTLMSQEANGLSAGSGNSGGGKPGGGAPLQLDRGHAAHAGDENEGMQRPPIPHRPHPQIGGIDVSEFQHDIDWSKVKNAGVKFAYIRATDGTTIQDDHFVKNWNDAETNKIPVGAYHYFETGSAVSTQVDNFVKMVKQVGAGGLPPVIDVENPKQFAKFTVPQRVAMIQQMLDGVQKELGVRPMLYMSSTFSSKVLNNAPQFKPYMLWVADYTTAQDPVVPKPWTSWNFWQHSDKGQVAGVTTAVDLDYFNGTTSQLPKHRPAKPVSHPKA